MPVLLCMGERDVCQLPAVEAAAFAGAREVTTVVFPRMAHMPAGRAGGRCGER